MWIPVRVSINSFWNTDYESSVKREKYSCVKFNYYVYSISLSWFTRGIYLRVPRKSGKECGEGKLTLGITIFVLYASQSGLI